MKQDFIVQEMEHIVEVAKAERHVVSKKRDAVMYKKKFGEFHFYNNKKNYFNFWIFFSFSIYLLMRLV